MRLYLSDINATAYYVADWLR